MGATVIAVIETVLGVLLLLVAVQAMGLGGLAGGLIGSSAGAEGAGVGAVLAGAGFVFGIIAVLISLLYFAIAYGVWKGRTWSWMLGVVVSIVVLVLSVFGLSGGVSLSSIISLALPIIVLYFLWQPDVKRYLGRA